MHVTKDRMLSIVLILIIIPFFIESYNIPEKAASQTYSSAFYPRIILILLTILTIIQVIRSFLPKKRYIKEKAPQEKTSYRAYGYVISLFIITGFYVFHY